MLYNKCMEKVRINFSLTEEARNLLRDTATSKGISMTALLELMIRENCGAGSFTSRKFRDDAVRQLNEDRKHKD